MRDACTNSIINDNDGIILMHKMNRIRSHMQLKTVENLFHGVYICSSKSIKFISWCVHMQFKEYKIYFMVWTSEISNDDGS